MQRSIFGMVAFAALLMVSPMMAHAEDAPVGSPPVAASPAEPPPGGMIPPGAAGGHDMMMHKTPEERAAMRAKMEEHIKSLPPEKQAEVRAKMEERRKQHEEMREKLKSMSPAEREAFKKQWHEEHGKPGGVVTHGQESPAPVTAH